MFAGGHRPDITKLMQTKNDGSNTQVQAPNSGGELRTETGEQSHQNVQFDLSKVSAREEEIKSEVKKNNPISRERSRSKSPRDKKGEKPSKELSEAKREVKKDELKEPPIVPAEESKIDKPLSKEEKLRLAKEKLLKRKTEQPNE